MDWKPQPPISDAPAYREWIRTEYPKYVASLEDIKRDPPREDYKDNSRAEIAASKRELATISFRHACKLMREADEIEAAMEDDQ
jgi:hypothetical protein